MSHFYIPPRLDDLKNDGGLFYIDGGGDPLVKHWTSLYLFLQLRETNRDSAFCVKDPSLNGGYGYGGVLRKQQIVRANQAVEAEAGLLNLQRGVARGSGSDWQNLASGGLCVQA